VHFGLQVDAERVVVVFSVIKISREFAS
jgi:hypothetical protein